MTKVAYIFPGQGAQTVGMGKEFYESSPQAKRIFDEADQLILGLKDVIFNGPQEKLTSTAYCQPAIFTYSIAALHALQYHPKFTDTDTLWTVIYTNMPPTEITNSTWFHLVITQGFFRAKVKR